MPAARSSDPAATARARLAERRRALERLRRGERATAALDVPQQGPGGDLSTYDNHPADLGTDTWQRAQGLGLAADLGVQIGEVDAALRRVDLATYGRCETCGGRIPEERLVLLPEARRCVDCQRRADERAAARGGRPVEEEVLGPPFGRTFHDGSGDVGFDGEDAWQAVARYGGSDTPSDEPEAREYPRVVVDPRERHGAVEDVEGIATADGGAEPGTYEDDR